MNTLEELTLNQLKEKAIALGIAETELKNFNNKSAVITMIRAIQNVKPEPVKTLEPTESTQVREQDDRKWEGKVEKMKKFLASQPTIRVLIPLDEGEKPGEVREVNGQWVAVSGAVWSKTFNGYRVTIPKGKYWTVPEAIAENIEQEYHQTTHAGDQWKIDRVKPDTGEQVSKQLSG